MAGDGATLDVVSCLMARIMGTSSSAGAIVMVMEEDMLPREHWNGGGHWAVNVWAELCKIVAGVANTRKCEDGDVWRTPHRHPA